jgi:hypothetical protein
MLGKGVMIGSLRKGVKITSTFSDPTDFHQEKSKTY